MQNILQSRPVTKYRLNLVACFFLEPKNISGMLRHAELCPSSPNLTQELVVFSCCYWDKKKLEKMPCSGEWQIFSPLWDSWKSLACFFPLPISTSPVCLSANPCSFPFHQYASMPTPAHFYFTSMPQCKPNAASPA